MSQARILIVHNGLAKTGTTAVQAYLERNHDDLRARGVGVLSVRGESEDFFLTQYLLSLDNRSLPEGYTISINTTEQNFPAWPESQFARVISDEGLANIGPNGARAVIDYGARNGARCHVVTVVRNPRQWLYSLWAQGTNINLSRDWCTFIRGASSKGLGFLSKALDVWCESGGAVSVLSYDSKDAVATFCAHVGLPQPPERGASKDHRLNTSPPTIDLLLRAHMSEMVFSAIDHLQIPIKVGAIQRGLLSLFTDADPMFEAARILEEKLRADVSLESSLIGYDSFPLLSEYLLGWAHDAEEFLAKFGSTLHGVSVSVVRSLIEEARADSVKLLSAPETYDRLPQAGAIDNLPIDSTIVSLARTITYSLTGR